MHESMYVKASSQDLSLAKSDLAALLEAVVSNGGSFRFAARGHSMTPFIKDGDVLLLVRECTGGDLGDIVAFRCDHSAITVHRVIGRPDGGLLLKGDNNFHIDGCIKSEDILARVVDIERNGRKVRTGLGKEKLLIAALSRSGLLRPLIDCIRHLARRI